MLAKANDPCAAPNLEFPAFTFWRWAGQDKQIFVADATGQCIRPVLLLTSVSASPGINRNSAIPSQGRPMSVDWHGPRLTIRRCQPDLRLYFPGDRYVDFKRHFGLDLR